MADTSTSKDVKPEPDDQEQLFAARELFEGKYAIRQRIGWNGMALCYKAFAGAEPVVVGMLPIEAQRSNKIARAFEVTCEKLKALEGQGFVPLSDFGVQHGVPFVEFAYREGRTLTEQVTTGGNMGINRAMRTGLQICRALSTLHAQGVRHLDLTPSNILLVRDPDGEERVELIGAGLARLIRATTLTDATGPTGRASGRKGKAFIAPEALMGRAGADERADVYSVGALLFYMVFGHPPKGALGEMSVADELYDLLDVVERCLLPADERISMDDLALRLNGLWNEEGPRRSLHPAAQAAAAAAQVGITEATGKHHAAEDQARKKLMLSGTLTAAALVGVVALMTLRPSGASTPEEAPMAAPPAVDGTARADLAEVRPAEAAPASSDGPAAIADGREITDSRDPDDDSTPSANDDEAPQAADGAQTSASDAERHNGAASDSVAANAEGARDNTPRAAASASDSPFASLPANLMPIAQRAMAREKFSREELTEVQAQVRAADLGGLGHALVAEAMAAARWFSAAGERYDLALRLSPELAENASVRESLIYIAARPSGGEKAQRTLLLRVGAKALPEVTRALEEAPALPMRRELMRLKARLSN